MEAAECSCVQVVGRVHKGLEILETLNEAAVDPDDLPLQRVTIIKCGLTDSKVTTYSASFQYFSYALQLFLYILFIYLFAYPLEICL